MSMYGGLGRKVQGEIEPIGTPPPKRPVNPGGEAFIAGGSAASGGSGPGGKPLPQEAPAPETYGPTFRDVGHQQQTAGPQSIQEAYFPDAHLQAQQTGLHRGTGYQPGEPGYSGRDARFIAADIDVPPPGQPAGLDSREMVTNIPPPVQNPYGMGNGGTGGFDTQPSNIIVNEPRIPETGPRPTLGETHVFPPNPPPPPPPPTAPEVPPPVQPGIIGPGPNGTLQGETQQQVQPPAPIRQPAPMAQPQMALTPAPQVSAAPQMADARQAVAQQATPQQYVPRDRPGSMAPQVQPAPQPAPAAPQYQVPGAPAPQQQGVDVSTAGPQAQVTKPGDMPPETSNVLQRNMEGLAGSDNPLDTSLHNVLSQVLEEGADIDAESLVPQLKSERERLSSFRDTAQRQLLSDLARRGFQLGGAQEAAVLAELEREIATQTAQSFRNIVNDERGRADRRLSESMQIAAAQQQQAQQLGLSREQLGVEARLGLGREQIAAGQLGIAGEELGLRARTAYGQERLGQEQLAVQQRTALGQEALGYGQLGLGQETLGVQERAGFAQQQQAQATLAAQQRTALGQEALGFSQLDVQQQIALEQARLREQELGVQENIGLGQLDVARYGAETGRMAAGTQQYGAETQRMASQNDAVLRDLELSDKFQQFTMKLGFDTAAFEASMRLAEQGQTNELLGILNNYLNVLGQGELA